MNLEHADIETFAASACDAEALLKALANRHRLMILCELHKGERSVSALQKSVRLSQSALSQHLARLRADNLVDTRRDAQTIYYSISQSAVTDVISVLYNIYCAPQKPRAAARRKVVR
ncbi:MAG: ArsR family transcriptional regulator [Xanthobacteraceae bacterium]|nr:MAG: ArsR family transcriptional regulator [Xanthobacteraceae bacterium]